MELTVPYWRWYGRSCGERPALWGWYSFRDSEESLDEVPHLDVFVPGHASYDASWVPSWFAWLRRESESPPPNLDGSVAHLHSCCHASVAVVMPRYECCDGRVEARVIPPSCRWFVWDCSTSHSVSKGKRNGVRQDARNARTNSSGIVKKCLTNACLAR